MDSFDQRDKMQHDRRRERLRERPDTGVDCGARSRATNAADPGHTGRPRREARWYWTQSLYFDSTPFCNAAARHRPLPRGPRLRFRTLRNPLIRGIDPRRHRQGWSTPPAPSTRSTSPAGNGGVESRLLPKEAADARSSHEQRRDRTTQPAHPPWDKLRPHFWVAPPVLRVVAQANCGDAYTLPLL